MLIPAGDGGRRKRRRRKRMMKKVSEKSEVFFGVEIWNYMRFF